MIVDTINTFLHDAFTRHTFHDVFNSFTMLYELMRKCEISISFAITDIRRINHLCYSELRQNGFYYFKYASKRKKIGINIIITLQLKTTFNYINLKPNTIIE